ncbi:MAG: hypothetical protein WD045_17620 [Pirellulaceae bacterium]
MADHKSSQSSTRVTICPLCGTRISVKAEDAGRKIRCPDCEKVFPIKLQTPRLEVPDATDDEDDYGLKASDDADHAAEAKARSAAILAQAERELEEAKHRNELSNKPRSAFDDVAPRKEKDPDKPRERPTPEDYDPKAHLVKYPLTLSPEQFKGDARILGDVGVLMRWVFISLACSLAIYFVFEAVVANLTEQTTFGGYMYTMLMSMCASVVGIGVFIYLASYVLFIVSAVTSGAEELDWPETYIFDKAAESLYVALALFLSTFPLMLLGAIFPWLGFALTFFAFPVLFLSILDSGSIFIPWSSAVIGSIVRLPAKWALFWGATLILFLLGGSVVWALLWWRAYVMGYMAIPVAVLFVGYCFIYALWLGRLGWEISQLDLDLDDEDADRPVSKFATRNDD